MALLEAASNMLMESLMRTNAAEVYQKRKKESLQVKPVLLHAGYLNKEAKASVVVLFLQFELH